MITTYLKKRLKSFVYAFKGIGILFKTQPNAQIHLLGVLVITVLGFALGLSRTEWCLIIICIALVLLAEAINTALEFLTDLTSPDIHPLAEKTKDVAAGGVLLSVIICGIVWGIIYIPKLIQFFTQLST